MDFLGMDLDSSIWKWVVSILSANPEVYGNVLHDEVLQDVTRFPQHRSTFFMFFYCGRDGCDVFVAVIVHLESSGGMGWNILQKRPEQ